MAGDTIRGGRVVCGLRHSAEVKKTLGRAGNESSNMEADLPPAPYWTAKR